LRNLDAFNFRVIVFVLESVALDCVLLHFEVVESANSVEVGSSGELLQLLLCGVEVEDFLHAVEVLSHVVFVGVNAKGLVNLILHYVGALKKTTLI